MSARYAIIKKAAKIINFQKIMAQPYSKLQETFKTAAAVPKIPALQDPDLTFETQTLCGQPVLYIKHKQPVQKVCVYVVGGGMLKYPKPSQAKGQITLAKLTGRNMVLPYYPLVPQHNLTDVYAMLYELYTTLLKTYKAEDIAFLGDSSGGNHTLGLISYLKV